MVDSEILCNHYIKKKNSLEKDNSNNKNIIYSDAMFLSLLALNAKIYVTWVTYCLYRQKTRQIT